MIFSILGHTWVIVDVRVSSILLTLEKEVFSSCHKHGTEKKILSRHEELNLRPSDYILWRSEVQFLMGTQNFFLKKTSFFISLPSSKLTISLISIIDLLSYIKIHKVLGAKWSDSRQVSATSLFFLPYACSFVYCVHSNQKLNLPCHPKWNDDKFQQEEWSDHLFQQRCESTCHHNSLCQSSHCRP